MKLRTVARDCLYLNWAVPLQAVPAPPRALRYEIHRHEGENWVFVSALLFRHAGLHLQSMPFARLSYPQMNLRLYVVDDGGEPSVLFRRMLVPAWVAPVSRYVGQQPALAARLHFPDPIAPPASGEGNGFDESSLAGQSWEWSVTRGDRLALRAWPGAPQAPGRPVLGTWQQTVDYFRNRRRGYVVWDRRLRALHTEHPPTEAVPMQVEMAETALLANFLDGADPALWSSPHSAWLCPELPFIFELGPPVRLSDWSRSLLPRELPTDLVPGDTGG